MKRLTFPLMKDAYVKHDEGKETPKDVEKQLEQVQPLHVVDPEHVFFLLKPLIEPLVLGIDKLRAELEALIKDMHKSRTFYDANPAISTNIAYEVAYYGYKYLFIYTTTALTIATNGGSSFPVPANQWVSITLPRGTKLTASGVPDSTPVTVIVRASDELLSLAGVGNFLGSVNQGNPPWTILGTSAVILNLPSLARATYSAQQFTGLGGYTELAIRFNVTALTGGTSPTVTFKISDLGDTGNIYQLEQATALSAAGVITYNIGAGLDNKSFGDGIQVDMVLTGAPTSVTFSASIKAKI